MKQVIFTTPEVEKNRCLADSIKFNLVVDTTTITEKTPHLSYDSNLPETITPEMVKELAEYNSRFNKAAYVALAETAAEVFVENKDATRVVASVGYFAPGDSISYTIDRSQSYPLPKDAKGESKTVTKHLVITSKVELKGTTAKSLRTALSTEFQNRFAK